MTTICSHTVRKEFQHAMLAPSSGLRWFGWCRYFDGVARIDCNSISYNCYWEHILLSKTHFICAVLINERCKISIRCKFRKHNRSVLMTELIFSGTSKMSRQLRSASMIVQLTLENSSTTTLNTSSVPEARLTYLKNQYASSPAFYLT